MKATCTYDNLKSALHATEVATSKGGTLSILHNILIETDGSQLSLSATNLEIGIVKKIQAKIDAPGKIVVSAGLLGSFLTALRGTEHIVLHVDGHILTVESGAHKAKINGFSVDDFPIIPQHTSGRTMEMALSSFKNSLAKVAQFTSKSEARIELTGVCMTLGEDTIALAATDSFRLGEIRLPAKDLVRDAAAYRDLATASTRMILPQQLCAYIAKLSDEYTTAQLSVEDNHLFLQCGNLTITARLIDGTYPDYQQIIPQSIATEVMIAKEALMEAMKVTTVFTGRDSGEIRFAVGADTLTITTRQQEIGENMTELPVTVSGDAQELVLNPRYVIDGVGRVDQDDVSMGINGNAAPVVFRGSVAGTAAEAYTYIVMPVKSV